MLNQAVAALLLLFTIWVKHVSHKSRIQGVFLEGGGRETFYFFLLESGNWTWNDFDPSSDTKYSVNIKHGLIKINMTYRYTKF